MNLKVRRCQQQIEKFTCSKKMRKYLNKGDVNEFEE
jgi:hypothetical protein